MDDYIKELIMFDNDEISEFIKDAINDGDKNRIMLLKAAVKLGMSPNYVLYKYDIPLLHYAILKNDILIICNLILLGCDIFKKDRHGFVPLHICAKSGNMHLLKFFIDKTINYKQNLNEKDIDGNTALFISCYFGHVD